MNIRIRLLTGLAVIPAALWGAPCSEAQGQTFIESGLYQMAVQEFTCLISASPTEVAGYRGRIEAELLLGRFADAAADQARITALVLPVNPTARLVLLAGYTERLKAKGDSIPALTGMSFARWWYFDYSQALHHLNRLIDLTPNGVYANLLRGSARVLSGAVRVEGLADLERAITLAPASADVRFIVADAYTYGHPDPTRAFAEASLALSWGLNTPRIHAILSIAHARFGNDLAAAAELKICIDLATTQLLTTGPLAAGATMSLPLVAGRTYDIPVVLTAGQTLSIATSSPDFYDTILVLLAPDGTPLISSDNYVKYFAGLNWVAGSAGVYKLRVSSFEGVDTGELVVTRK